VPLTQPITIARATPPPPRNPRRRRHSSSSRLFPHRHLMTHAPPNPVPPAAGSPPSSTRCSKYLTPTHIHDRTSRSTLHCRILSSAPENMSPTPAQPTFPEQDVADTILSFDHHTAYMLGGYANNTDGRTRTPCPHHLIILSSTSAQPCWTLLTRRTTTSSC
jgi:hypothetical protein